MDTLAPARPAARPPAAAAPRRDLAAVLPAAGAFALLCILALSFAPRLVEPDDYAYRASIVAMTQGHFLSLSGAQLQALAARLSSPAGGGGIAQWVQLASGRWISEKDPGYPFLAAPFQALGIIRLAPLFYGALGCLGLYAGGRRWLGRFGGTAAVILLCSSGAAMLFAWRDYMPTFTDAALIAAGTGTVLWAVLAGEATAARRAWTGLAGFAALEAAVFVRYTDIVVLGCVMAAVALAWRRLPAVAAAAWLVSAAGTGAGLAVFDTLVYGGPLTSGYRPGEITFSLSALGPNLRWMPARLADAMPELFLALAALAWIILRHARLRRARGAPGEPLAAEARATEARATEARAAARRDLAIGLALAACWLSLWALYLTYTWTAGPFGSVLQDARFYVPAIGPLSLLGAWLVTRLPGRAGLAAATAAAVTVTLFGLGAWSYAGMRDFTLLRSGPAPVRHATVPVPGPVRYAPGQGPTATPAGPAPAG